MSDTYSVDKRDWRSFFDRISKSLEDRPGELRLESLEVGNQVIARDQPLRGIFFDEPNGFVDIALENVDHRSSEPKAIFVRQRGSELNAIEIIDKDDSKTILTLIDPLLLPAS